jgi:hypothetical protein
MIIKRVIYLPIPFVNRQKINSGFRQLTPTKSFGCHKFPYMCKYRKEKGGYSVVLKIDVFYTKIKENRLKSGFLHVKNYA